MVKYKTNEIPSENAIINARREREAHNITKQQEKVNKNFN
jgi:hypothetical protein